VCVQGSFICTYVGKLYTSEEGNRLGGILGDEYYADLDLIEIVERGKVGDHFPLLTFLKIMYEMVVSREFLSFWAVKVE